MWTIVIVKTIQDWHRLAMNEADSQVPVESDPPAIGNPEPSISGSIYFQRESGAEHFGEGIPSVRIIQDAIDELEAEKAAHHAQNAPPSGTLEKVRAALEFYSRCDEQNGWKTTVIGMQKELDQVRAELEKAREELRLEKSERDDCIKLSATLRAENERLAKDLSHAHYDYLG